LKGEQIWSIVSILFKRYLLLDMGSASVYHVDLLSC